MYFICYREEGEVAQQGTYWSTILHLTIYRKLKIVYHTLAQWSWQLSVAVVFAGSIPTHEYYFRSLDVCCNLCVSALSCVRLGTVELSTRDSRPIGFRCILGVLGYEILFLKNIYYIPYISLYLQLGGGVRYCRSGSPEKCNSF